MEIINKTKASIIGLWKKKKKTKELSDMSLNIQSYTRKDGTIDFEKYKSIQTKGNKDKIENIWVIEENIKFLSEVIMNYNRVPDFGICHGTRRGLEQKWFSKYLNCSVLGTEISDTAKNFPSTIQWDFHKVKKEWIGKADFIYSNSFDHSYDPKNCIRNWMACLKPNGICILEHSDFHGPKGSNALDPFGAEIVIMPYLIIEWSKGEFAVTDILDAPSKKEGLNYLKFLIIQNRK